MSPRTLIAMRSLVLAAFALLGSGLAFAAVPASPAESNNASPAPQYRVELCCQLCPKAADPKTYEGSSYLEEFSVLMQGREGWLFRSRVDLATQFEISDVSLVELKRLAAAMRARGSELVVVLQPPRALMDVDKLTPEQRKSYDFATARKNYAAALQRIRSAGVVVPPLDEMVDENKGYEYFFRRDHHWTPSGAEATAKRVAKTVQQMPAFRQVPRQTYVTRASALLGKPGTMQKVASQICGGSYSMQYLTGTVTELADSADGTQSLLGDAPATKSGDKNARADRTGGGLLDTGGESSGEADSLLGDGGASGAPQIALIGTSNSDTKGGYNFGGYLRQYIGADILGAALSGGSFDGALLRYLPSEAYQKHPPKIVIWEMPWQFWPGADKNPYRTFRQALPLVHDGCRGRSAAIEQTIELKAGSNELLFNAGAKPLQGGRYWLDLQFDDPTVKDLHAVVWYYTGQKESLKLHFNQYVDNGGRFVTEFRHNRADYAKATFLGATLEMDQPPAKPLKVTARVCAADGPQQSASSQESGVRTNEGSNREIQQEARNEQASNQH